MIGPLLRVAASGAVARSLRTAAQDTVNRALLTVGAAFAIGLGAIFLTFSAFAFLESLLDPAGASAIVGASWALSGVGYFVATRRRRT
jgi:MYXO-CTERM domain-containing protein